jgi:hypothetical protein
MAMTAYLRPYEVYAKALMEEPAYQAGGQVGEVLKAALVGVRTMYELMALSDEQVIAQFRKLLVQHHPDLKKDFFESVKHLYVTREISEETPSKIVVSNAYDYLEMNSAGITYKREHVNAKTLFTFSEGA